MSSVLRSNETWPCDPSVDDFEYNRAAGIAVMVVLVASFLVSCSVIVATVVAAKCLTRRESYGSDDEIIVVVKDNDDENTNNSILFPRQDVLANGTGYSRQFSRQTTAGGDDILDSDVFKEDDDSLSTLYDKLTIDAEKMYGPILVRYRQHLILDISA